MKFGALKFMFQGSSALFQKFLRVKTSKVFKTFEVSVPKNF